MRNGDSPEKKETPGRRTSIRRLFASRLLLLRFECFKEGIAVPVKKQEDSVASLETLYGILEVLNRIYRLTIDLDNDIVRLDPL